MEIISITKEDIEEAISNVKKGLCKGGCGKEGVACGYHAGTACPIDMYAYYKKFYLDDERDPEWDGGYSIQEVIRELPNCRIDCFGYLNGDEPIEVCHDCARKYESGEKSMYVNPQAYEAIINSDKYKQYEALEKEISDQLKQLELDPGYGLAPSGWGTDLDKQVKKDEIQF